LLRQTPSDVFLRNRLHGEKAVFLHQGIVATQRVVASIHRLEFRKCGNRNGVLNPGPPRFGRSSLGQ